MSSELKRKAEEEHIEVGEEKRQRVEDDASLVEIDTDTAIKQLVVPRSTALVPFGNIVNKLDDHAEIPTIEYIEQYRRHIKACAPEVRYGTVRTKSPDAALHLWSLCSRSKIFSLELAEIEANSSFIVEHKELKDPESTKKKPSKTGEWMYNVSTKFPQSFPGMKLKDMHMLSPFCMNWIEYGNTEDTGVNGSQGKMIKGSKTENGKEVYELSMTNEPYCKIIQDDLYNNPLMSYFSQAWKSIGSRIMENAWMLKTTFIKKRLEIPASCKKNDTPLPSSPAESIAYIMESTNHMFKSKITLNPQDTSRFTMSGSQSVYRPLGFLSEWGEKPVRMEEREAPPSAMFERNTTNVRSQKLQCRRNLPVYRMRRHDEVIEGVVYDSPFILIPANNVRLTKGKDVVATLFALGMYDDKFEVAGLTNKQVAYVWLNTKKELDEMTLESIVPCNPMYACPMAGIYRGPNGVENTQVTIEAPMEQASDQVFDEFTV